MGHQMKEGNFSVAEERHVALMSECVDSCTLRVHKLLDSFNSASKFYNALPNKTKTYDEAEELYNAIDMAKNLDDILAAIDALQKIAMEDGVNCGELTKHFYKKSLIPYLESLNFPVGAPRAIWDCMQQVDKMLQSKNFEPIFNQPLDTYQQDTCWMTILDLLETSIKNDKVLTQGHSDSLACQACLLGEYGVIGDLAGDNTDTTGSVGVDLYN